MRNRKLILLHLTWMVGSIILILTLFFPLIFQSKALFDEDTIAYDYPATFFYKNSLESGSGEIGWNPHYMGGYPTYLSPVGNYTDPLYRLFLRVFSDPFSLHHTRLFISVFLALISAFYFARSIKLSNPASVLVSLGYIIAPTLGYLTGGLQISGSLFFLPTLLLVVKKIHDSERGRFVYCIFGVAATLFALLAGFMQAILYSILFAVIYSIYLDANNDKTIFTIDKWKKTFMIILVTIAGGIIAFPLLSDTISFRSFTERTSGFGSMGVEGITVFDIPYFVIPDYLSVPYLSSDFFAGFYLGAPIILFIILAIFMARTDKNIRFYLFVYGATILMLIAPLKLGFLFQQLPVLSFFHNIKRLLLPGSFFLLLAAGSAFDAVLKNPALLSRFKRFFHFSVISISLVFLIASFITLLPHVIDFSDASLQRVILERVSGNSFEALPSDYLGLFSRALSTFFETFSFLNWKFTLPLLFFPLCLAALFLFKNSRISKKTFSISVVILMLLNVTVVYGAQFNQYIPKNEFYRKPALSSILAEDSNNNPYYLMTFLVGDSLFRNVRNESDLSASEEFIISREALSPNLNIIYKISRIDGYEPYAASRHLFIWNELIAHETLQRNRGEPLDSALQREKSEFLRFLPLISSYNVKYILSGYPLDDSRLEFLKLIRVGRSETAELYLYNNVIAHERIYIPKNVLLKTDIKQSSDEFNAMGRNKIFIECMMCEEQEIKGQAGVIDVQEIGLGHISFTISAENPNWIVVAQSDLPGWRAYIDNRETQIHTANYLMQGVYVPEGQHDIKLIYKPKNI